MGEAKPLKCLTSELAKVINGNGLKFFLIVHLGSLFCIRTGRRIPAQLPGSVIKNNGVVGQSRVDLAAMCLRVDRVASDD
jgi:hydrogenase-4 membrane subunit HyfE